MKDFIDYIEKENLGTYKENVSFKTLTTYKTGGNASLVYYPKDTESLIKGLEFIKDNNISYKVFGNGSNILASDNDYEGVIIKLSSLNNLKIEEEKVEVESGYNFALLCNEMTKNGLEGLDFGCGIPGTVGGAIYMNAGAYLKDTSEVLDKVLILDENYEIKELKKEELNYSYRNSIFMEKNWIILKGFFTLKKGDKEELISLMEDRKERRFRSQPLEYPSAGSVFRNPENNFAGKLIEESSLRGFTYGGAEISGKHANFIINKDNATSSDILYLMNLAKDKVKENYGIDLKREQELFNFGE